MKKINFKCTVCGCKVSYNKKLENLTTFTCSNCNAEYDENIFKSTKKRNSRIYFNDIKAVGPDGSTRTLPTLSVKIR